MKLFKSVGFLIIALVALGCSSEPEQQQTFVKGRFSVSDSIDQSKNFSGIGFTIIKKDSANADADTLFYARTDSAGLFEGIAKFSDQKEYLGLISRNGKNLGQFGVVLADEDTLSIMGELPDLEKTLQLSSREHDALKVYRRVSKAFQRVRAYMQAGKVSQDSISIELKKWSNLFWSVYEDNAGTLASRYAASESIELLQGWNNKDMMAKINQIKGDDYLVGLAATYGKDYLAESRGLNYTLGFLDSLQQEADVPQMKMRIQMQVVELLYDSARVQQAKERLAAFEARFKDNKAARVWSKSMSYDLNYLSPGDAIPEFSFQENGKTISRDSLLGQPYLLEISSLANELYQQQYDRTVVIHSIYKNFGLQVLTIPLDDSQVRVDAFFQERVKPWPVAPAQAFDRADLLKRFNIQLIPTRFLIDRKGKIYRKYVGREYQDVIQGIQAITKVDKQPS